jgi:hypothetical protein
MKGLYVLAAAALLGCGETSAPTSVAQQGLRPAHKVGDVLVNDWTPVELQLTACNGETVSLTGDLHYLVAITQSNNGSVNAKLSSDYTFSGVGDITGAGYEGGMKFTDHEIINQGAATNFSIESSVRLIGKGSVLNTWFDFSTDFTINANGDITHNNSAFTARCS